MARRTRTAADWYRDNRRRIDVALVVAAVAGFVVAGWSNLSGGSDAPAAAPAAAEVRPSERSVPASGVEESAVAAALRATEWGRLDPSLDELRRPPEGCTNVEPGTLDDCSYGDPQAPRTAVVVGDSVAMAWVPAVRAALGDGWRVQQLTLSECPATALETWRDRRSKGEAYAACLDHRAWARSVIERLRPDLVVTSSLPEFANRIVGVDSDDPRRYEAWGDGLADWLREVRSYAQRTVVLAAPPASGNLQTCVTARSGPADCVKRVSRHWLAVVAAESAAARAAGAGHVDPVDWFCATGRCPAVVGSTPVLRDGTHLTAAYARQLGPQLRPLLLAPPAG